MAWKALSCVPVVTTGANHQKLDTFCSQNGLDWPNMARKQEKKIISSKNRDIFRKIFVCCWIFTLFSDMVNRFHLQGRVFLGKIFTFGRDGNVNDARSKFLRFSRSRDFLFQVWKQSGKTPRIVHFQACLLLSVIWRFPGMFTLRCFSRAVNKILEKSIITSARGG